MTCPNAGVCGANERELEYLKERYRIRNTADEPPTEEDGDSVLVWLDGDSAKFWVETLREAVTDSPWVYPRWCRLPE